MKLTVYRPDGTALFDIIPDASSGHDWSLMTDNRLSLSFELESCTVLMPGCYVDFDGIRYYIIEEYKPTLVNSMQWKYNVTFKDAASWLAITVALNTIDGKNTPIFQYTAPAAEHAAIIVANLNRRMNTTAWTVGSVIDTGNISIDYNGKYCADVLQEIVDGEDTEWWVDGMTLNIGRAEFGNTIELGYRQGLLGNITCAQSDNMRSYAYLFPVGSTRNIDPTKYGYDRLQLPNGQTRVDMNVEQGVAELVEEKAFSHIFPRYIGKVTNVATSTGTSEDGEQFLIYFIEDKNIPFNPNDYELPGAVKHIIFQSGELMGSDFEVNYNAATHEFEIITQWPNGGGQLPGGLLIPAIGDEYVVWNISMPDEYYPRASQEFLEAAEAFAASAIKDASVYKATLDYIDARERGLTIRPGQRVRLLSDEYFSSGYYDSRITRITRKLDLPDAITIDVSAVRVIGTIQKLQNSLQSTASQVAQVTNTVQTVVQNVTNAVSLTGNQLVRGMKDFVDGLKIGGLPIRKINENTVFIDANVAFGGAATMFGKGSTTFPTIWANIPIDGKSIGRNEQGELYVIGGTGGGVADSVAWSKITDKPTWIGAEKPSYSYSEITDTPDLGGFVTAESLTELLSGKADKATTLAGYGITDAYTKDELNTEFAKYLRLSGEEQSISAIHDFTNGLLIGGLPIKKSQDKTIYIDANLVISGAMTMFGKGSTTFPTIWANIPFNPDHMTWDGSQWSVVGGGGASVTKDAIVSALGYTPLSANGGTISGLIHFNNTSYPDIRGNGSYITFSPDDVSGSKGSVGLYKNTDSSYALRRVWDHYSYGVMDLGASGYRWHTVYAKSGNYSDDVTAKSFIGNLAGNATTATSAQYLYQSNIQESINYPRGTDHSIKVVNCSSTKQDGFFSDYTTVLSVASPLSNFQLGMYANPFNAGASRPRFRAMRNTDSVWTDWKELAFAEDLNNYLPTSGGTVNGNILFEGERILKSSLIGEVLYMGSSYLVLGGGATAKNISTYIDGKNVFIRAGNYNAKFSDDGNLIWNGATTVSGKLYVGTSSDSHIYLQRNGISYIDANGSLRFTVNGYSTTAMEITTSGNVAIGGASGSEKLDVKGNALISDSLTVAGVLSTYKGSSSVAYLHVTNETTTIDYAHLFVSNLDKSRTDRPLVMQNGYGNVAVGGITASEKLSVYGNVALTSGSANPYISIKDNTGATWYIQYARDCLWFGLGTAKSLSVDRSGNVVTIGAITMFSQASLKNIINREGLSLDELAQIRPARFKWKDGRDDRVHVGAIADEIVEVLPEVVYFTGEEKTMTMDYASAGHFIATSLIKPVIDHETRIKYLEAEVQALKEENNKLKQLVA